MKVFCISNCLDQILDERVRRRLSGSIHREFPNDDLVIGQSYAVVALSRWEDGGFRVYLHTVKDNDFPYPYPLEMFKVIEPTIPARWIASFTSESGNIVMDTLGFPEWVGNKRFYEKLIEGDLPSIEIYKRFILE